MFLIRPVLIIVNQNCNVYGQLKTLNLEDGLREKNQIRHIQVLLLVMESGKIFISALSVSMPPWLHFLSLPCSAFYTMYAHIPITSIVQITYYIIIKGNIDLKPRFVSSQVFVFSEHRKGVLSWGHRSRRAAVTSHKEIWSHDGSFYMDTLWGLLPIVFNRNPHCSSHCELWSGFVSAQVWSTRCRKKQVTSLLGRRIMSDYASAVD